MKIIILPYSSDEARQFQEAIMPIPDPEDIEERFFDPVSGEAMAGVLKCHEGIEIIYNAAEREWYLEYTITTKHKDVGVARASQNWWPCVTRYFERDGNETVHILELPVKGWWDSWIEYEKEMSSGRHERVE